VTKLLYPQISLLKHSHIMHHKTPLYHCYILHTTLLENEFINATQSRYLILMKIPPT